MTEHRLAPPTGEVTFLFTDVEGSTGLWERNANGMEAALAEHDRRLRDAIGEWHGYIFTTAGDSFAVAFASPADALAAAIAAQLRLVEPCGDIPLRVRMGLHTGTASARDADYFGAVVNRCARLMSAAHGGQVLVSGTTADLVRAELDDGLELMDCGEHRLKDLLRPEHIHQLRHPELGDEFPPLRTLTGPSSNLPTQLTSFVGREQELADVCERLGAYRLVTLIGAGGAGKTRLALQSAADSSEDFPDGIRFVELDAVAEPDLVCDEVALAVGAQAVPDVPLVDSIAGRIGAQRTLLVIDNCEHMVKAVGALVEHLLGACENLKVLTTSRERLAVPGEATYRVPSLSMPETTDLKELRSCDSVQLFTERALLASPDFEVTEQNAEAVAAICVQLDGIPLALELAAARIPALAPMQIAELLGERFRLLGGPSRGAIERHRTLAAAIEWSYDHLSDADQALALGERRRMVQEEQPDAGRARQALFRATSVFRGSFSLDAAATVCAGGSVGPLDVLDHITALVDKSMLVPEGVDSGEVRYRSLESLRQFGAAKLAEDEGTFDIAARHAEYFVVRCESLQIQQRSGDLGGALAGLSDELDNVRAALRFSLDAGRFEPAARIVGAIGYLWYASGAFREGIEWCRELFDTEPDLPDEVLATALHAYGLVVGSWTEPALGVEVLTREVELRRHIGDPARLAGALNNLGNLQNDLGLLVDGEVTLREAVERFHEADQSASMSLTSLAYGYKDTGDYETAEQQLSEALDEAEAFGDDYAAIVALSGLGESAVHRGNPQTARALALEAREGFEKFGVTPGIAHCNVVLALAHIAEGDPPNAAASLLDTLAEPDAHWYQATKYWMLHVAAGLIDDRRLAAKLVGVAERHYATVEIPQPAWVRASLEETREMLQAELGTAAFATACRAGRALGVEDAIAATVGALHRLADPLADAAGNGD